MEINKKALFYGIDMIDIITCHKGCCIISAPSKDAIKKWTDAFNKIEEELKTEKK